MQKLKLDHTLISFLPILVFLPITYQIINNFHIGGLDLFLEFVKAAFTPKINSEIINISKNLQIKNIIKLDAMASDQASLDLYNVPFYKSEDIYLDQLQIQDLRQVYENTTLSSYISTDPIAIVNEKLNQINLKKQQILIELEQLKNG